MPIYEYNCRKCGRDFEELVMGNKKPACPGCGSRELSKKFSTFAAHSGDAMPSCAGATPSCSRKMCESGRCGMAQ